MPGNKLGLRLSRLVRERAYLGGELSKLERQETALQRELRATKRKLGTKRRRAAWLDAHIVTLSSLNPDDIRPIRQTPRVRAGRHGEFVRELVRVLKEAGGAVEMRDLVRLLIAV